MSIFSSVTVQDLDNLHKLAEQQKNQRAPKIKNRILKQTRDIKLAESLSPITKKLHEVKKSTQKIGDIIKESNYRVDIKALLNNSKFSNSMREMNGSLMHSHKSLKITQDELGRANILGVPIQLSGADTIKIKEKNYELTPELYKSLSYATYHGKTMKNEKKILMMNNITKDLGYTGIGDRR